MHLNGAERICRAIARQILKVKGAKKRAKGTPGKGCLSRTTQRFDTQDLFLKQLAAVPGSH